MARKQPNISLKPHMGIMLIAMTLLFGLIFGWKAFVSFKIKQAIVHMAAPTHTVSTMNIKFSNWQSTLHSIGNLRATLQVNVTSQLPGMIDKIYFSPGARVKQGDILVQLNPAQEIAALHALEAQVQLAKITYQRDQAQFAVHAVSKQTVEVDAWNLKNLEAQVAQSEAVVEKKIIRAPFSGQLGISNVYQGQYLNPGDAITTLQTFDPMYVDFYLPQQVLGQLKIGQTVLVTTDAYPGKTFKGKITTIEPRVDINTRNIEVEATVNNPLHQLRSGMFASVNVVVAQSVSYLTLPQSAISFNSFGDYVFVVKQKISDKKRPILFAEQAFVTTGKTRGDEVAILTGLKEGQTVVISGHFKLKNGSIITIDNTPPLNNTATRSK